MRSRVLVTDIRSYVTLHVWFAENPPVYTEKS